MSPRGEQTNEETGSVGEAHRADPINTEHHGEEKLLLEGL